MLFLIFRISISILKSLVADIILQKPQHIIRCMAVVQFPFSHSPVRNMDELAKIFPVQSCAFTQLNNSVFTIHPSFLHKSKKYTLRNHYSIAVTNTQRVNYEILRSLVRQRLRLITFLEMLQRLYINDFNFDADNIQTVKNALLLSSTADGNLYGKTGTGNINGENISGWFIGYVETSDNTYKGFFP